MDQLTIENFRCFQERKSARLAPLTLLVGENSTGKTSFLAMVRILWNAVYYGEIRPDFKDPPYDLGTFREFVHRTGSEGGRPQEFSAGFGIGDWNCAVTFAQGSISTEVVGLSVKNAGGSANLRRLPGNKILIELKTENGSWKSQAKDEVTPQIGIIKRPLSEDWGVFLLTECIEMGRMVPDPGSVEITSRDKSVVYDLVLTPFKAHFSSHDEGSVFLPPAATAPVRSRPKRTYDPGFAFLDPEGESAPAFLAALDQSGDRQQWQCMKSTMEAYGSQTGLFDEIRIQQRGDVAGSDPFQVQIRKHHEGGAGSWRNLVDVGYGVSQILPVIVELIKPQAPPMLLLQQPEVHLHPSAQAGLGSILCNAAALGRQLLVETHSDYLVNRVRMDVRDRKTELKPEDVSILFFERTDNDVSIHNIRMDEVGNVLDNPPTYRQFFMDEINRSLGI